jgi:hypothetical protein
MFFSQLLTAPPLRAGMHLQDGNQKLSHSSQLMASRYQDRVTG